MKNPYKTETGARMPVDGFNGGHGYRFVCGPPARFPWNDFTKPDEASWIAFEIAPGEGWPGDALGLELIDTLDKFVNEGLREASHPAEEVTCDHGTSFKVGNLFTIYPRSGYRLKKWENKELADTLSSKAWDWKKKHK